MTDSFNLGKNIQPYCNLPEDMGLAEAWDSLEREQVSFAMINNQGLINSEQLIDVNTRNDMTLLDYFEPSPPKLSLAAEWDALSPEQLSILYEAIEATGAPGIVIERGSEMLGVLSAETLAAALPPGMINVSRGPGGTIGVGFHVYVCGQCGSMRIPSQGDNVPPLCPKSLTHGPMHLEQ